MTYKAINSREKFDLFAEQWEPKVIAEIDYQFKIVKLTGDFIWHDHPETDESFLVIEGNLRIDFLDGAGEMFVVLKGSRISPMPKMKSSYCSSKRATL